MVCREGALFEKYNHDPFVTVIFPLPDAPRRGGGVGETAINHYTIQFK